MKNRCPNCGTQLRVPPLFQLWELAMDRQPLPVEYGRRKVFASALGFITVSGCRVTAEIQWVYLDNELPNLGPALKVCPENELPIYKDQSLMFVSPVVEGVE